MKQVFKSAGALALACALLFTARGQSTDGLPQLPAQGSSAAFQDAGAAQKLHSDSIQRVVLRDSLGLTDAGITQVFAIRDTCLNRSARILTDATLSPGAQNDQVRVLRDQAEASIRNYMGQTMYEKYINLIMRRKRSL